MTNRLPLVTSSDEWYSSLGAETHNDCVSGATFVNKFANSFEVAGLVGSSAPTDPGHFLMVRFAVAV